MVAIIFVFNNSHIGSVDIELPCFLIMIIYMQELSTSIYTDQV